MEKLPGTDDIYQVLVSSDDEDFSETDDGSVGDLEMDPWADWCGSIFETAFDTFPSQAVGTLPVARFSDHRFTDEELADMVGSVHREVPMLPMRRFADVGVAVFPPVAGRPVGRTINRSVGWKNRMDKVSVLS